MDKDFLSWKIAELPSVKNDFSRKIKLMKKYKNYPWPFNLISHSSKASIKNELDLSKVEFNEDFYCLFGNLKGGEVYLSNSYILDYATIYFGNHITIGPDVKLITSSHSIENFNIVNAQSIFIEDNVWLTMNIIVLPGVRIGENSVIGAGSVVANDIPPNSLAAGNPAKVLKKINRSHPYWEDLSKDIEIREKKSITKKIWLKFIGFPNKLILKFLNFFI